MSFCSYCVRHCAHTVRHCARTVYVIVLTLCKSLCSHCLRHCAHTVHHCAHTQVYSDPVTIGEMAIVQLYVTKETDTTSSSREEEDVKEMILLSCCYILPMVCTCPVSLPCTVVLVVEIFLLSCVFCYCSLGTVKYFMTCSNLIIIRMFCLLCVAKSMVYNIMNQLTDDSQQGDGLYKSTSSIQWTHEYSWMYDRPQKQISAKADQSILAVVYILVIS